MTIRANTSPNRIVLRALLPLSLALGCATNQPSKTLVDAREAVDRAAHGQAKTYAPDELLEAQKLLNSAEKADSNSVAQDHFAYLADRQARLAESEGEREMHQAAIADSEQRYAELQNQRRADAEAGLEKTRQQLLVTQQELGALGQQMLSSDADLEAIEARRKELERAQITLQEQLNAQGTALAKSERAREAADARADAAIASLKELAQVKEEANETIVTLAGAVLFKTGDSQLLPLAEHALDQVASALKQLDESQVVLIKGHTDSNGAEDMNRTLSQARSDAVRSYLITQGVRPEALRAVGKGEAEPIADNGNAEGRANNRRVEIVIPKSSRSGSR